MTQPLRIRLLTPILAFVLTGTANAQTVLDGVYSDSQAQRGQRTYRSICADCHEGGEPDADPLMGQTFIDRWREAPLTFLHGFISRTMSGDDPGSLSALTYVDTLAYLLKANGYPVGNADLREEQLQDVLLTGRQGPAPVPAYSLVMLVGCLETTASGEWVLEAASDIIRVRSADETNPTELAASAARPSGTAFYHLANAGEHMAGTLQGKRVQAKGVLTDNGTPARVNVLSLVEVGTSCDGSAAGG